MLDADILTSMVQLSWQVAFEKKLSGVCRNSCWFIARTSLSKERKGLCYASANTVLGCVHWIIAIAKLCCSVGCCHAQQTSCIHTRPSRVFPLSAINDHFLSDAYAMLCFYFDGLYENCLLTALKHSSGSFWNYCHCCFSDEAVFLYKSELLAQDLHCIQGKLGH